MEVKLPLYWLIIIFLLGATLAGFFSKPAIRIFNSFKDRAQVIKQYWMFAIPFSLITAIAYVLTLSMSPANKVDLYVNILGQSAGLIFAIFVGYFAFAQVAEGRLDKLIAQGQAELGMHQFDRAILTYEMALAIAPNNFKVLSNLLELYILSGKNAKYEEKFKLLEKNSVEPREKLIILYLLSLEELLKSHMQEARAAIAKTIDFVKANPRAIETFNWSFNEVQSHESYNQLTGEVKTIMDNYLRYLQGILGNDLQRFEGGNYTLPPIPTP